MKISAAILAGGKSRRMGSNKALLQVRSCRIIDHCIEELQKLTDDITIITNQIDDYIDLPIKKASDIYPGLGPLAGIHSALLNATYSWVLVVACDMPFIDAQLANYFIQKADNYEVVVPEIDGYFEPLFALYSNSCLKSIENCLTNQKLRVVDFFSQVKVRYVNEKEIADIVDIEKVFYNINTPKELALAKHLL